jgi:integration host factor subunit alpha
MTKRELVEKLQDVTGFTLKESADLFDSVMQIIKETLERGENIKVSGFGNFEVRTKAKRQGRNPQTGGALTISSRRVLVFKPSNLLKQAINC